MNRSTFRLLLGIAVFATGGAFATVANAVTATNTTTQTLVKGDQPNKKLIVSLSTGQLNAGERRFFSGRISAVKLSGVGVANPLQAGMIDCPGLGSSKWTTTNNLSSSSATAIGVRFIASVPATGTYTCHLWAWADSMLSPQNNLLTVAAGNSWLSMDDVPHPGAGAWFPSATTAWIAPGNTASPFGTTLYWNPTGTGSSVRVMADPQITNNDAAPGGTTTITARLYVQQLNSSNALCTATSPAVDTQTFTLSTVKHHQKVLLDAPAVPVSTAAPCIRRFRLLVNVTNESGPSLRVEGSSYTSMIAWPN